MTTTTDETQAWSAGDAVVHPGKPDWGGGTVLDAKPAVHEGTKCQRVTIRFDRVGTKTLLTAFVKLRRVGEPPVQKPEPEPAPKRNGVPPPRSQQQTPPPSDEPAADPITLFSELADELTDPFRSADQRLTATLKAYEHTKDGPQLMAWAIAQSGLRDPLALVARTELEQLFDRHRVNLGRHLLALARAMSPSEIRAAGDIAKRAVPEAQRAWAAATARR